MFPTRKPMTVGLLGLVVAAIMIAAPPAGGARPPTVKPVIGQPVTVPAQPLLGQRFAVSFRVTRSDTHKALLRGTMICDPSVAGVVIPHAESFTSGVARLAFVVPTTGQGKQLQVKVTIKVDQQSATRISTFKVAQLPTVSIGDMSAPEGSSGTTTLSFPVTLSAAYALPVSVGYATADATATASGDYTAANGTLTFKAGETAKTIAVSVVADTAVEQDETFTVALSNPVNATIADGTATGTIKNDDVAPRSGHYAGSTSQGKAISFDVSPDLKAITNVEAAIDFDCPGLPPQYLFLTKGFPFGIDGPIAVAPDWSFTYNTQKTSFVGKLALPGSASGTLHTSGLQFYNVSTGQTIYCNADVTWNAA